MRSPFRHLETSGNGTTIRDRREEATGTQYIHPIARFPSIIVIGGQSIILTTLTCAELACRHFRYNPLLYWPVL